MGFELSSTPERWAKPTVLCDISQTVGRGDRAFGSHMVGAVRSFRPPSAALRWLNVLSTEELVGLEGDPTDHRRKNVILPPRGAETMANFLYEIEG